MEIRFLDGRIARTVAQGLWTDVLLNLIDECGPRSQLKLIRGLKVLNGELATAYCRDGMAMKGLVADLADGHHGLRATACESLTVLMIINPELITPITE